MKAVTLFILKETPKIRELFSEISRDETPVTLVRSGDGLAGYLKRSKIELLLGISRDSEAERAAGAGPLHPGVLRAVDFLKERYHEKLSLEILAKSVHLSKFRLCHLFKEQTGRSPGAYLLFVRVSRAKELLRQRDQSITEVARSTGFGDPSYFSKSFSRLEGMTPLAYRNKMWPTGSSKSLKIARLAKKEARNDKKRVRQWLAPRSKSKLAYS
jgi:AraC-like DNA-binding protein